MKTKADWDSLDHSQLIVIDFFTNWCGPCLAFAPRFKQLAFEYQDRVQFCKVDCEDQEGIVEMFTVNCYPTLHVVKSGQSVCHLEGANEGKLRAAIETHLN